MTEALLEDLEDSSEEPLTKARAVASPPNLEKALGEVAVQRILEAFQVEALTVLVRLVVALAFRAATAMATRAAVV